ncbi:hypothetical protein ACFWVM_04475 [Nocardia fluminea]|uniref:hypothetical protein n=1 Tax=Nocardia fluminea TaxID=134984 RepID=UPI00364EC332
MVRVGADLTNVTWPILLVDTLTHTGWTTAVAAHVLHTSGPDLVLPSRRRPDLTPVPVSRRAIP